MERHRTGTDTLRTKQTVFQPLHNSDKKETG